MHALASDLNPLLPHGVEVALLVVVAVLVILPLALWVLSLVDAAGRPSALWAATGQAKGMSIALMLVLGLVGVAFYWFVTRPRLVLAARGR
ncbi:hypothetical protein [Nocardioides bruguierae]|uniref:hypothetical protein n=1 Tax=Nocardioides bruguierae TaxID=2945102 RepID=UPI002021AE8C|nr:hypothetical protein [Nocardioides bruguierae]MCL8026752.1 hypothetical protein [Nocardioides bruguierae]